MATKTLLTQIRLRRDNDVNYEKIKTTFIPLKGEVCLVDVVAKGLHAKVGDGVSTWEQLPYADEDIYTAINQIVQRGYYYNGAFYTDRSHTEVLIPSSETIYIEADHSLIYIYNTNEYISIIDMLPSASAEQAGIVKLYSTTGQNTDGTMTQKAITTELNKKIEASVDMPTETLVLSISL